MFGFAYSEEKGNTTESVTTQSSIENLTKVKDEDKKDEIIDGAVQEKSADENAGEVNTEEKPTEAVDADNESKPEGNETENTKENVNEESSANGEKKTDETQNSTTNEVKVETVTAQAIVSTGQTNAVPEKDFYLRIATDIGTPKPRRGNTKGIYVEVVRKNPQTVKVVRTYSSCPCMSVERTSRNNIGTDQRILLDVQFSEMKYATFRLSVELSPYYNVEAEVTTDPNGNIFLRPL